MAHAHNQSYENKKIGAGRARKVGAGRMCYIKKVGAGRICYVQLCYAS